MFFSENIKILIYSGSQKHSDTLDFVTKVICSNVKVTHFFTLIFK